ncbi:SDR family NAD(P)-dependent oxidoreductase [Fodinicola acaciae]|uniref:SDR family NAD(P)-dependent oxidoreductase n=1 Tax=Fodinicola acaciae TaxID=2681555 RepID=UPI0013D35803|nr:SDR family NAD(P)-dependent oxidoreductase [Fodinicola acaciae]
MVKTIAIFGTGPGMSRSVAVRFGRAGFRVALVARTRSKLDKYVGELAAAGIEAAAFTADVTDGAELLRVIGEIEQRFGHIDVAEFSPGNLDTPVVNVMDVDPDDLPAQFNTPLWAPIRLVRALLPGMLERGDGAFLIASGASVLHPSPMLGNAGMALGALRHYVQNLHNVIANKGVYIGLVHVGGPIERSDMTAAFLKDVDVSAFPFVNPDDLAETAWDMYLARDGFERTVGGFGQ